MNHFIITSHGWSASNWLAYALNLHPEIVCSHSARNIPANERGMNSDESLRANLLALHKGYLSRSIDTVDAKYEQIEKMGNGKFYGSVHVLRMRDLPYLWERFGPNKKNYTVMNLVRHPVSLVWSGYGQFKSLFRYDLNELHWTLGKVLNEAREFIHKLALKYDFFPGDIENLAFIGASAVLGSLRKDLDAYDIVKNINAYNYLGAIKMEEVTNNPDVLSGIIAKLTNGRLSVDEIYLRKVFRTGVVNEHKSDKNKTDASARYQHFNEWQKEVFKYFFEKYQLKNAYESYGYDFSFID